MTFDSSERTLVSPMVMRQKRGRATYWCLVALLTIATLTTMLPLYWMFSGALKTPIEMLRTPPTFFPLNPNWGAYIEAWNDLNYTLYFRNTVIIVAGALAMQLLVSATAAYSLSKLKPAFGKVVLGFFLTTLMVPSAAYLIPQYLTVESLPIIHVSLLDSWWAIWLPQAVSAFNIFLLKSFFDELPQELTDAALIDGANAWQVLLRIILPLSKPVLAVVGIFTFIATWKEFFWPLLVLNDRGLWPIGLAIYDISSGNEPLNLIVAGLAIATIPPLVLFLIFQKQIISGITLTGLKG